MVLELLNTRPKNEKFPLWRRLQVERSEKDESKHDEQPALVLVSRAAKGLGDGKEGSRSCSLLILGRRF